MVNFMDDKGLLNKPQDDKPTDDDQKRIDEALNQLPDTSRSATPPEPAKVTSSSPNPTPPPPPSIPSTPPPAPAATPVTDDKPIPTEEVKIKKPKGKLKKNAKKIVGGVLVLALLVGGGYGVYLTRKTAEEKQVVESEAVAGGPTWGKACQKRSKKECSNCVAVGVRCVWDRNQRRCKERKTAGCRPAGDPSNYPGPGAGIKIVGNCPTDCTGTLWDHWLYSKCVGTKKCEVWVRDCKGTGNCAGLGVERVRGDTCVSDPSCRTTSASPEPTPTPTPSPSVSPSPSPSPGSELSCVELRSDTDPIEYGNLVTFTCEGSFSSVTAPVAYFKYSVDDGASYTVLPSAYAIDLVTNTATMSMEIDQYGEWRVQCRVCEDNTAASCTTWGQAN